MSYVVIKIENDHMHHGALEGVPLGYQEGLPDVTD